jgi:transposase
VLSLPATLRIFLAAEPADMRKGFDGLSQLVRDKIAQDPLSGHLYVFRNRRRDRIKILYWDRDGLALWYKRLEKGTFRFPEAVDGRVEVTPAEMAAILEGIDLRGARRRPRFALPAPGPPENLTDLACSIEDAMSPRRSSPVVVV